MKNEHSFGHILRNNKEDIREASFKQIPIELIQEKVRE